MLQELDSAVVARRPGEHVCVLYRSDDERDRLMAAYLRDGLQIGHTCLCVAGAPESAAVLSALRGSDVSRLDVNRRPHRFRSEAPTPPTTRLIADWSRATFEREDATSARVVADVSWVLPDPGDDITRYEANATTLATSYAQSCVCLYDLNRVDYVIYELISMHAKVRVGGVMLENPYTSEADSSMDPGSWL
jgi:hypothetical protein